MPTPKQLPWAILLCRYNDDTNNPDQTTISQLAAQWRTNFDASFVAANLNDTWDNDHRTILELYQTFFTITGLFTFNAVRYWDEMSHGKIYVGDTQIFPCVLDRSIQEAYDLANKPGFSYQKDTFQKAKQALQEQHGVDWKDFTGGVAVSFQYPEFGAQGGWYDGGPGVFMDIRYVKNNGIQAWGQEMGHAFGLDHSRTDGEVDASGVGIDYTDPFDIMSTLNAFSATDTSYGMRGPGLNAWNMRSRKWLDETRVIKVLPSQELNNVGYILRPLHKRYLPGTLAIELPGYGGASNYLIEFRVPDDWDAGIGGPRILIHRFEGPLQQFLGTHSYLMKGTNGQKFLQAGDVFEIGNGPYSRVKVDYFDMVKMEAGITICHSQKAKAGPSVKIGNPNSYWQAYNLKHCRLTNIEGTLYPLSFTLKGSCLGTDYQILWSVNGASTFPAGGALNQPIIDIFLPDPSVLIVVSVTILFADGISVSDTYKFHSVSQDQANWFTINCNLLKSIDRMEPIPWWRWDPKMLKERFPQYTKSQWSKIAERMDTIAHTVRQLGRTEGE